MFAVNQMVALTEPDHVPSGRQPGKLEGKLRPSIAESTAKPVTRMTTLAPEGATSSKNISRRRLSSETNLRKSLVSVSESLGKNRHEDLPEVLESPLLYGDAVHFGESVTPSRKSVSLKLPRSHSQNLPQKGDLSSCSTSTGDARSCTPRSLSPSNSRPSSVGLASQQPTTLTVEQVEDLRMQNAILRRSLSMLQQSVVESFKGNKSQFVGGGHFRKKSAGSATSGDEARSAVRQSGLEPDPDLEALQEALTRMRGELVIMKQERDTARKETEDLRRRVAELAEQHKKAAATAELQRQRNENITEELAQRAEELRAAERALKASEERLQAAMQRSSELNDEVQRLETSVAEGQQLLAVETRRANAHQGRVTTLEGDLIVLQTSKDEVEQSMLKEKLGILSSRDRLQEECDALRDSLESYRMRLGLMQAERKTRSLRLLTGMLGEDTSLWVQACFGAWSKVKGIAREARLHSQITALKEESAKHATAVREAQSKHRDAETAEKRCKEVEERLSALEKELLLSKETLAAHAKRCASAEQATAKAEKKRRELEEEIEKNKADRKSVV